MHSTSDSSHSTNDFRDAEKDISEKGPGPLDPAPALTGADLPVLTKILSSRKRERLEDKDTSTNADFAGTSVESPAWSGGEKDAVRLSRSSSRMQQVERIPTRASQKYGSLSRHSSRRDPSPAASEITYPEGGLQANLIVFGAFSGMFAGFGFMNTIGTLQAYISSNQLASHDESSIGWIFSLYIFLAFFGGIQTGPAFDRWGPRGLVTAGGLLLVGGVLGLANSTEYAHFIVTLSIMCGLGTTLIFTPCISVIAHYFNKRRGSMTGLAATGGSVGGVLFPLVLPSLFSSIGFTWALRVMALVFFVACCVCVAILRARLPPKRGSTVLPDFTIFRNVDFALTSAGVFAMEFGLFVPLTFFSSWAQDAGLGDPDPAFPFRLLAILNGASFFGRWLPGIAADYLGRFNTLAASMAMSLLFLVAAWLPAILLPEDAGRSTLVALAVVFALGFGFAFGSGISLTPVCVGELCDPREYGRWYATCYSVVSFGCLTGVPIGGVVLGSGGPRGWASLVAWTSACYAVSLACFVAARVRRGGWSWNAVV